MSKKPKEPNPLGGELVLVEWGLAQLKAIAGELVIRAETLKKQVNAIRERERALEDKK